ncbi:MAG: endonuclease Q family protein [Lentisphaeria bacterium]|jgi:DNA helicase-2/ATP-dependent DNA helicase PcrA
MSRPPPESLADLHLHSRFSLATSPACTLEGYAAWAQRKGLALLGSGDATHPGWRAELERKLAPAPAAPGLYRLRAEFAAAAQAEVPASCHAPVHFLATAEVACVWSQGGRLRKVHALLLFPTLAAAAALAARLAPWGRLDGDGRPTLRLALRELFALAKETAAETLLIPAHIWTPWFGLFGARSGFDSLAEAFGDLAGEVLAAETGLSSDPPMNARWSALDRLTLVASSDAHSPAALGRNATIFRGDLSFPALRRALASRDPALFGGTLHLFPQEGKYYHDGHRACGVSLAPAAAAAAGGRCPACGRPLTPGVLHRIQALADRPLGGAGRPGVPPYTHLIPLPELLAEMAGRQPGSPVVRRLYGRFLERFGPELPFLRHGEIAALAAVAEFAPLAPLLRNLRAGLVNCQPGADGRFGTVRAGGQRGGRSSQVLNQRESSRSGQRRARSFMAAHSAAAGGS